MTTVFDVAAYILAKQGEMTAMKLQKLAYYSQAWSLVWDDAPMYQDRIEAWANGPVTPALYQLHRGHFGIASISEGDAGNLTVDQSETIDAVLGHYGDKSSQWLSDLTHREKPWQQARRGLADGQRGNSEITLSMMAEYYGSL